MKNMLNKSGKHKTQNQEGRENIRYNTNKHRPEIRDDLDSREDEEQDYKGDDVTHNRKPHHNEKHTTKK
jgi:hypothetical protein